MTCSTEEAERLIGKWKSELSGLWVTFLERPSGLKFEFLGTVSRVSDKIFMAVFTSPACEFTVLLDRASFEYFTPEDGLAPDERIKQTMCVEANLTATFPEFPGRQLSICELKAE